MMPRAKRTPARACQLWTAPIDAAMPPHTKHRVDKLRVSVSEQIPRKTTAHVQDRGADATEKHVGRDLEDNVGNLR